MGVQDKSADTPRKRPSTLPILDYVVVSDTLSGLGAGEKPHGSDPDDCSTLTEMMNKKALEDKKRKLDEQAVALLASKRKNSRRKFLLHLPNLTLIWVYLVEIMVTF
ncbi:hypothetical protein Hanom_Chr17g01591881 [Helianthus anomalus]